MVTILFAAIANTNSGASMPLAIVGNAARSNKYVVRSTLAP